jgi:ATP-binding cassette subfamily B protein
MFPVFTEKFISESGFIKNRELNLIFIYGLFLVGLYILHTAARYIMAYWGHMVGVRMEYDMRFTLFKHYQNMDVEYFDNHKTGKIMSRITHDLREITELAHHGPEDLFISIVMLLGTFIFLVGKHVGFTFILYGILAVMIWFSVNKRKVLLNAFLETRKTHAEINAKIESSISGIRLTKSYANEEYELDRFEEYNVNYRNSYVIAYKRMAEFAAGNAFFLSFVSIVTLVIGGWFAYEDWLTIDELFIFLLYTTMFVSPIRRLVQFTQQFQQGFAGFTRFAEIMDIQPKILDKPDAVPLNTPVGTGTIELRNVSFKYSQEYPWVLKNFNLTVKPGKTVALVGPTGVGKTTITYLIPRFYEVQEGEVLVNGTNVQDLQLDSLREQIGFVQQDIIIFYGSIKDNILYGKPSATDEEIITAAKQANIHEFIMTLPHIYDSIVGERGIKLSGGQKQRLSLARVFLQNPPMLILDEATSSLDNATELAIQESIEKLAKNRTTLVVAHRLSTIKNADEILVITQEGIVEHGTHDELLAMDGIYAGLYNAQFEGFLPENLPSLKT